MQTASRPDFTLLKPNFCTDEKAEKKKIHNSDMQASAKRGRYCEKAAGLEKHGHIVITLSLSRAGSMQTRYGPAVETFLQSKPQLGQCNDAAPTELEKQLTAALRGQTSRVSTVRLGRATDYCCTASKSYWW